MDRLCLEDLVDPDLYAGAINDYLQSWPPGPKEPLQGEDLPERERPAAVKAWCTHHGLSRPSKVHVAEAALRVMTRPTLRAKHRWADARRMQALLANHRYRSKFGDWPIILDRFRRTLTVGGASNGRSPVRKPPMGNLE